MPRIVLALIFASFAAAAAAQSVNHIGGEGSSYLQLHMSDGIDWYPWGPAAIEKAKRDGKPLFVTIGYASCHWCHVMEQKAFSDPEVARMLNAYYVPVVVDREEHPDLDAALMTYVESMSGSAGWPANLLVTPELAPFFAATYLEPEELNRALVLGASRWANEREAVVSSAREIVQAAVPPAVANGQVPVPDALRTLADNAQKAFDAEHGGFGTEPKFPQALLLDFLLRESVRRNNADLRRIALTTLRSMAEGSIHDQIGGGFHRYATDSAWRKVHYEKMLYDQALLLSDYVIAWQLTREPLFADVARDTGDYMLRDLQFPGGGGFVSSQDADSVVPGDHGPKLVEAEFYFWTPKQVRQVLGKTGDAMNFYYGINDRNPLPFRAHSDAATRKEYGYSEAEWPGVLATAKARLLEIRQKRPQPFRDEKVLAGWNGLAISALAHAGAALGERRYLDAATTAARVVQTRLWIAKDKRLLRSFSGDRAVDALASDYAQLIAGLVDLYEATFDIKLLTFAVELQQRQDQLFWDAKQGRYTTGSKLPSAVAAAYVESDRDTPSANSLAVRNLVRLGELTDRAEWRDRAAVILRSFAADIDSISYAALAAAYATTLTPQRQIVIAGDPRRDETKKLIAAVHERFLPNAVVMLADGGAGQIKLGAWLPYVKEMVPVDKHAAAYVCEQRVCKLPTTDPEQLAKLLDELSAKLSPQE